MKILLLAIIVSISACTTIPVYEVTQRIAVERATHHSINDGTLKESLFAGSVVPGSPLDLSITYELQRQYKLTKRGGESRGLPTLRPEFPLDSNKVDQWVNNIL